MSLLSTKKLLYKIITKPVVTPDNIEGIVATLNSSGSIAAGASCNIVETDVSSYIPAGKKLIDVEFRGTANHNLYCWYFHYERSSNTVQYRLHNVSSSAASSSPTCVLRCVPNE